MKELIYWGLKAYPDFPLPRRLMLVVDFLAWIADYHKGCGSLLSNVIEPGIVPDWLFTIGVFNFFHAGEVQPDTEIVHLIRRRDNRLIDIWNVFAGVPVVYGRMLNRQSTL